VYRSPAVTIFRNPTIVERLTLYHHAFVMKNQLAAALALRFPSFDVLRDVALEAPASTPGTASSGDHIDISLNDALHVEARVTTASPAVLVQTDTFYPGWVAYVDGKPTTIMRADAYFRAVAVPAGTHVVDIRYESVPVIAGEACSMLALLCLLSLLMAGRVRRNLASPAGPVGLVDQ
jgi:hypothetical protein